ncbi:MAG: L-2-hydroxyglutarate oxidase [Phycisphaeraceae bacterium]|nr:L-2-hydroxyglutarate oxidase [Phycisphaeraceae bacterium]
MSDCDVLVIGGGIVGLATACTIIKRNPAARVIVLEKEPRVAAHQTGHNSGVIHSGIYYKPGSLKALNCRRGKDLLESFCNEHRVPFEICGKVIVAVDESERPGLHRIFDRGQANGVRCEMISAARLHELEPAVRGVAGIHVPETGIISYTAVCNAMVRIIEQQGSRVITSARATAVNRVNDVFEVQSKAGVFAARAIVNCAGLHSDRVTSMTGARPDVKIVPFRGEYFALRDDAKGLCRNLIYPVPDPNFPFLGVHFTRMIDGKVECGPNAVLAFAREGYSKSSINLRDLAETLSYPAFWKIARKYWRTGAGEFHRSFSKHAFVSALQRLIPDVAIEHLQPAPAGVRAQALSRDGILLDDFSIEQRPGLVNICNAPSPAATSSLSIAEYVVDALEHQGRASGH